MQTQAIKKLTRVFPWTSIPVIVGAPMRILTGPSLAVEVSKAGGLGFIGPGAKPEDLKPALIQASKLVKDSEYLSKPNVQMLPIGVGFQTWAGNLDISSRILKEQRPAVAVVWLFAPRYGQVELDDWARGVREASPGTQIWIQVASVADAVAAARSPSRPDVLVIQGSDAGGHSLNKGAGIITLLPEVADALEKCGCGDIPLIAAGGISEGRGVASALTLGAAGIAMGTRFLASKEAFINPGYQRHIIEASDGGQNTVRTQFYNHLRGTLNWPEGFGARGIINQSWRDQEDGVPFEKIKKLHDEALKLDKAWGPDGRTATYAGTGIGLVREVKSAGEIVQEVRKRSQDVLVATTQQIVKD